VKLCANCGKPDHAKHFCVPLSRAEVRKAVAPVVHRPVVHSHSVVHSVVHKPSVVHAVVHKEASPVVHAARKDRHLNTEARKVYRREWMRKQRDAKRAEGSP
jgi:hypothetical protein